jgi:uncharacterized protein YjbJ (UPF0337 family)
VAARHLHLVEKAEGPHGGTAPPNWPNTDESPCHDPTQPIPKETTMNWDQIEGNWKDVKGKVKEKWGKLTDDDMTTIEGQRDQLAGKLQKAYGYGKEEAEREIDEFSRDLKV